MLSARQPVEDQPGPSADQPSWCVCRHCPMMDRDQDKICCGMAPQYCDSQRPEMGLVITDPLTLHIQQTYRNDVFAHQAVDVEDTNCRFAMLPIASMYSGFMDAFNGMTAELYLHAV
ncbi:hypothetical protein DPMN_006100 [Dreissena polymorpha]|uniref:P2X purinoreceptor 7 intracellular domain-containing protein n=1 Tax=Dreissena polymorpha TaxID=45954 RepID=A0A9D4MUL4_DREPO|nr:hypothetical protein DPMN_006100 [Dreissena polymorpha]